MKTTTTTETTTAAAETAAAEAARRTAARAEANAAHYEAFLAALRAAEAAPEQQPETRTETTTRTRAAYEAARETDRLAAARLAALRAEITDALRARRPGRLSGLASLYEAARDRAETAAAELDETRSAYLAARSALQAADLLEYMESDPRALLDLAAASVSRAIDRREAESAADGRALRMRYAATRPTITETMEADAVQEAAADLLAAVVGDPDRPDRPAWIDGETDDGTPRAALPLAYVAARSAGRALDRIMYADGGRAVKMTAREAREAYRNAADLAPLADRADLYAAEAAESKDPETIAAAREARAEYLAAARRFAASAVVVETRRTVDPIAPGPEAAAIEAERVERVLAAVRPAVRENAAAVVRAVYEGAESIREAGRMTGISEAAARRAWTAVRNAAALILAEDGETRDLERLIASDERTRAAMTRRREAATVAHEADRLAALPAPETSPEAAAAVRSMWADVARRTRPERLAATARFTPADLAAVRDLAARLFHGMTE